MIVVYILGFLMLVGIVAACTDNDGSSSGSSSSSKSKPTPRCTCNGEPGRDISNVEYYENKEYYDKQHKKHMKEAKENCEVHGGSWW